MAEGTGARLDTVDIADGYGWRVDSTREVDVFSKGAATIEVRYSADDVLVSAEYSSNEDVNFSVQQRASRQLLLPGQDNATKHKVLRAWLSGGVPVAAEPPRPVHSDKRRVPKLRWSRENWLHKPTQEVVDNSDPRVPRTIAESKKQGKIWHLMGSQADVDDGYYRREMDVDTTAAAVPTYTATWHPRIGPVELLIRGNGGEAYWACVRHHQAKFRAAPEER